MKRFLLVGAFFAFILFVILEANNHGTNSVFQSLVEIPHKDKIGHFSLHGLLGLLLDYALLGKDYKWKSRNIPVALIWVMSFAIVEEISQYWIPSRNCDYKDAIADLLGVAILSWAGAFYTSESSQLLTLFISPPKKSGRTENKCRNGREEWFCCAFQRVKTVG